jgi:hypothetical protein
MAVVLGIGAPLLMALVWGRFAAPASRTPLPIPALLVLKQVQLVEKPPPVRPTIC